MFKSTDRKSLLIGGLLALLVVVCFAGSPWLDRDTFDRFRMEIADGGAFILDTATGQAWAHIVTEELIDITPGFYEPKVDPNTYVPVRSASSVPNRASAR